MLTNQNLKQVHVVVATRGKKYTRESRLVFIYYTSDWLIELAQVFQPMHKQWPND